jgi:hypothetical protein
MAAPLFTQKTVACIWDFDKTLIPEYMQSPLFRRYRINEPQFWEETNRLSEHYQKRGYRLSSEISYLNHLLTYVQAGLMAGLNNKILRDCGKDIVFYPGLPEFFDRAKLWVAEKPEYAALDIQLEHYIVSTGIAEMIRGSKIFPYVDGIWGCEFIENPLQPGFLKQKEFELSAEAEIAQIGMVIDNTTKTRALFEINKGTNKIAGIDVNTSVKPEDRRIPFQNMIYIADGPSDIPSFSVVKSGGGTAYAVHNPNNSAEFAQNDQLLQSGRINGYGPADYTETSSTARWLQLHVHSICDRIVADANRALAQKTTKPPKHLNTTPAEEAAKRASTTPKQASFL